MARPNVPSRSLGKASKDGVMILTFHTGKTPPSVQLGVNSYAGECAGKGTYPLGSDQLAPGLSSRPAFATRPVGESLPLSEPHLQPGTCETGCDARECRGLSMTCCLLGGGTVAVPRQKKSKGTGIARPWERNRTVAIPGMRPKGNREIAESPKNVEQEGASETSTLPPTPMRYSGYVYVGNMT